MEMLVSIAIGTMLMSGLLGPVMDGLQARDYTAQTDDIAIQAEFAMGRMVNTIRNTASPAAGTHLSAAVANSTSNWLTPGYVFNPTTGQLLEVNGTNQTVVADHVTAFGATLHTTTPASPAVFRAPLIDLVLTLGSTAAPVVTLRTTTRIGGGTL